MSPFGRWALEDGAVVTSAAVDDALAWPPGWRGLGAVGAGQAASVAEERVPRGVLATGAAEHGGGIGGQAPGHRDAVASQVDPDRADAVDVAGVEPGAGQQ